MFQQERHTRMLNLINVKGKATVAELSELLNVSNVTVRRDLEKLEEHNLLVRTHGGALSKEATSNIAQERSFFEKEESWAEEKERIATAAASLVNPGESILLSPGTTNMLLAHKLMHYPDLTLITNAANIVASLGEQCKAETVLLGGKLRQKSFALVGPLAEAAVQNFKVDKLFLGVDGFHMEAGLTTPNIAEANMNRLMIAAAKEVIVVTDHSKFGKVTLSKIAPIDVVTTVISDHYLSNDEISKQIKEKNIKLMLV